MRKPYTLPLTPTEIEEVVAAWLEDSQRQVDDDSFRWAHDLLQDFCLLSPVEAWPIVLRLVEAASDVRTRQAIGVGPIESLFGNRVDLFELLIDEAARNAPLRECLVPARFDTDIDGIAPELLSRLEAVAPGFRRA